MENNFDDRRNFPRAEFPCKIMISSPLRLLASHTENISEGGIRVMVEEKLTSFTMVGIEIYVDKSKPIKCKGKIAWVKEMVNPVAKEAVMYDVGVQFTDINEFDKNYIKKMVAAIKPPSE